MPDDKSIYVASKDYECMDCGETIRRGDRYCHFQGVERHYIYCMGCRESHRKNNIRPEARKLVGLLRETPLFNDELISRLGYGVDMNSSMKLNRLYQKAVKMGYPVHKMKYVMRSQSSRTYMQRNAQNHAKNGYFVLFWIDGTEIRAIERINDMFEEHFVRRHIRDLYLPILGVRQKCLVRTNQSKVVLPTQGELDRYKAIRDRGELNDRP